MKTIDSVKHGVDVFLRLFVVVLFIAMIALVTWQVFIRQALSSGDVRTEVLARIVFVWQGLIGAAYVIGEKEDVAIDFFVRKLPGAALKGMQVLAHLVIGFFAAWVLVWGGFRLMQSTIDDTVQLLPVSQGVVYAAVPITGILIMFYTIYHIIKTITETEDPSSTAPSGDDLPMEKGI